MKKIFMLISLIVGLGACSESHVDFGEQYKKTLYIVNSRDMLYTNEHKYGDENNEIMVSVYCASTEPIKSDVHATVYINPAALDSMNWLYALGNPLYENKVMLPESFYEFSSGDVVIPAGQQYGVLRIPLETKGLNPDINYALPITLESNSAGYDINPELNTLIYEIKMINGFSGHFFGSSVELQLPKKVIRSVQPELKALTENTVRMPIHNLSYEKEDLDTNFMVLTIGSDSTSVTIKPWKNAQVKDLGGCKYDPKKMSYELHYACINADGDSVVVEEKIKNMDAPEEEEELEEEEE